MLRKANDVKGFTLGARDGEIGRVKDFYFDDQNWAVRYLVADTNKWLPGRKVLLSPYSFADFDESQKVLRVNLTKDQIRSSPSIDEHMPISRQYEIQYYQYYNWPYYWQGTALWGPGAMPTFPLGTEAAPIAPPVEPAPSGDAHLRSMAETDGYRIHARNGEIGHLDDFLIDDRDWRIRYLDIATRNWLPGKHVLIAPEWVNLIDWEKSEVRTDLEHGVIEHAPDYDSTLPVDREYERRLFEYYQQEPYWHRLAA